MHDDKKTKTKNRSRNFTNQTLKAFYEQTYEESNRLLTNTNKTAWPNLPCKSHPRSEYQPKWKKWGSKCKNSTTKNLKRTERHGWHEGQKRTWTIISSTHAWSQLKTNEDKHHYASPCRPKTKKQISKSNNKSKMNEQKQKQSFNQAKKQKGKQTWHNRMRKSIDALKLRYSDWITWLLQLAVLQGQRPPARTHTHTCL